MATGGRGEIVIRTSDPVRDDGKKLSLRPEIAVNIIKKDRVGLDA